MIDCADRIRRDLADYCANLRRTTNEYDPGLRAATEHFLQELETAKTTPAQLVVLGAQLCGSTDENPTLTAARAVQMTHVAAHMNTQDAQARAAAGIGMHAAHILLANMDAPEALRIKMLSITNRALMLHAQAQAYQDQAQALHSYATELVLNPLHVGMVLADADCAATDAITPFALALGRYVHAHNEQDLHDATLEQTRITQWPTELLAYIRRTVVDA
ncbi:MAG TPA: hypothetical protein VJ843_05615 [Candidatus Saccharimonadales bacterium]|nr:hypothetical protein [Candidatus Saccharimonadales bacterium]